MDLPVNDQLHGSSGVIDRMRFGRFRPRILAPFIEKKLPPYPAGWYAIAFSCELRNERLLVRQVFGRDVVLFRTRAGAAAALDAYCPHLGAHFGHGGRVEGECIRCPFHGFLYDTRGVCVATGYGSKPPPNARTATWPLREVNEMLLIYHDGSGAAPTWQVPALDWAQWSRPVRWTATLLAHPQETTENSVDLGHFAFVHGYRSVRMLRDVIVDGAYLSTAYAAKRPAPLIGRRSSRWDLDIEFETHIYGLGYSQVDVRVPAFDVRARLWVLPTPIDDDRTTLRLAVSADRCSGASHPWLQRVPSCVRGASIACGVLAGLVADARRDFRIWEHKIHVDPPALANGDGPIGRYRSWAAQFY